MIINVNNYYLEFLNIRKNFDKLNYKYKNIEKTIEYKFFINFLKKSIDKEIKIIKSYNRRIITLYFEYLDLSSDYKSRTDSAYEFANILINNDHIRKKSFINYKISGHKKQDNLLKCIEIIKNNLFKIKIDKPYIYNYDLLDIIFDFYDN